PSLLPAIRTNLAAWSPRLVRPRNNCVHLTSVNAVALPEGARTLLVGTWGNRDNKPGPGQVYRWDQEKWQVIGPTLDHPGAGVMCLALSPDRKTALTGSAPHRPTKIGLNLTPSEFTAARLWDLATGQLLGEPLPHPGPVLAVTFSLDGNTFATGCVDG